MAGFGDMVQKAFYLGVGLASYAGEKAGGTLGELREQAQKLAAEMVQRGEMSTEEARRFVEEIMQQGQEAAAQSSTETTTKEPTEPRRIEIIEDDEDSSSNEQPENVDRLRQQVDSLKDELRRLQNE
jgi:polyhydroxyalkanoate synthesis regulator phasin